MFYGLDKNQYKILNHATGIVDSLYTKVFHGDMLITCERCLGFTEDKKFMDELNKLATNQQEKSLMWRLHIQVWAAHHCLHLPGDFVECGVYKGFCSEFMVKYLNFEKQSKSLFLYDTFEGIPQQHRDGSPVREGAYKEEGLYEGVVERFRPYPNVKVMKGVVPEIFSEVCPEQVAYLHLDLNSASAEIGALEVLFDRLVPGGMIVFDDYGWEWYRAQKEAEDKFFAARDHKIMELPTGQGLLVKRGDA